MGAERAPPALSPQVPSVLEAPVLGRWEKTRRRESGPRSKAGRRTEGQSEPRAGPMVSMATRVPGGANNPVFQSSATLPWWGEKVELGSF